MRIDLFETYLQLIDRVVSEGTYGKSREEVLNAIVLEHAKHLLAGGGPYDTGGQTILEVVKPQYGAKRDDFVLQPVTGKAIPLYKGEVLRITQEVGGQCVDFNGYICRSHQGVWADAR